MYLVDKQVLVWYTVFSMINHEVLTIDEVADHLRVDRHSVMDYIKQGKLKAVKIGPRLYRILRKDIEFLFDGKGSNE